MKCGRVRHETAALGAARSRVDLVEQMGYQSIGDIIILHEGSTAKRLPVMAAGTSVVHASS